MNAHANNLLYHRTNVALILKSGCKGSYTLQDAPHHNRVEQIVCILSKTVLRKYSITLQVYIAIYHIKHMHLGNQIKKKIFKLNLLFEDLGFSLVLSIPLLLGF